MLDRVIEETLHHGEGPALHFTRYDYDAAGNRTLVQTGDDKIITEYDAHKNPIKIKNALDQETHTVYNTDFENDLEQKVLQTTTTDPLGYQTIDTYDAANRLVDTKRYNPFGFIVAHQRTLYDILGNPCQILNDVIQDGVLQKTIQTLMTYAPDNQITSLTEAVKTPEQKITQYVYELGRKIENKEA